LIAVALIAVALIAVALIAVALIVVALIAVVLIAVALIVVVDYGLIIILLSLNDTSPCISLFVFSSKANPNASNRKRESGCGTKRSSCYTSFFFHGIIVGEDLDDLLELLYGRWGSRVRGSRGRGSRGRGSRGRGSRGRGSRGRGSRDRGSRGCDRCCRQD
jgi:hypothetical protein